MLLNKNIDKETIKILLQENRRLKRENQRLHESLDGLERYKNEYRTLMDEVKNIKGRYLSTIKGFEKVADGYRGELSRIMGNKGAMPLNGN